MVCVKAPISKQTLKISAATMVVKVVDRGTPEDIISAKTTSGRDTAQST